MRFRRPREAVPGYRPGRVAWLYEALCAPRFRGSGRIAVKRLSYPRNRARYRLTNGFSRKCANLEHAVALHHMHYNYVRRHKTLGTTPAVAAGIETREWTMADLVGVLEDVEQKQVAYR
jgi:hypothetical protein